MEQMKTVVIGACMLSLAVGLCHMIKPSRTFEKQVRFLVSMLFVICMVSPFLHLEFSDIPELLAEAEETEQSQALEEELQSQVLASTRTQTEAAIAQLLTAQGIACSEIAVTVHIDETGCISISEVSVTCDDEQKASESLRSALGEEVVLHVAEAAAQQ